jgi:GMP synthase-like glutamine amidotransferase
VPKCLVVQHVAPESPFAIAQALTEAGVEVEVCRVFAGDRLPHGTDSLDGLVVMGGPMSAASDDGFPSRLAELDLIAKALDAGIPTLGICLGAQLLALAAQASVYPGAAGPEVGWAPVRLDASCRDDPLFAGLPDEITVLHWHADTYDLPPGSQHLISDAIYAQQAFRLADVAWGIQFHLEVDEAAVAGFVEAFGHEAATGPGGAEAILAATPAAVAELAPVRQAVCARFAELVAARVSKGALVELN